MKHCLGYLMSRLNRNNSMLIKTGSPNLLHFCHFLCFNLMNYNEFEKEQSSSHL